MRRRVTCLSSRAAPARAPARQLARSAVGRDWRAIRHRIMSRDCGLCLACHARGILQPAAEVDHRIPQWCGGTDDDRNLWSLCRTCHARKTRREAAIRAAGGRVDDDDALPATDPGRD
ncbi:MAG: HNH endonuclease [Burkholderiaceae bacterium]|nr:HNH endonuclease [Burkholderiaceae bacterium]